METIRDLSEGISRIDGELEGVKGDVRSMESQLKGVWESIDFVRESAEKRLSDYDYGYKKLDKDGFCMLWYWRD